MRTPSGSPAATACATRKASPGRALSTSGRCTHRRPGRVVDPTWAHGEWQAANRYLGIEFSHLPEGDQEGISQLTDFLGGKLVICDNKTGRIRLLDGDSDLAEMVKADGGFAATGRGVPGSRRYERAIRRAS